eukprot:CAMPEP_0114517238 /NCGR_PEP_ID=MMETSP0109-20121206/17780_1 /TAXON_ID=29199 /ORGANISM="Chlorarachnion reptans, Strain CCCM449" /LENGTH=212 /DNA_ID=CAMNT_0001697731 /DNA_START=131 /DNA_END=769 /DNA_ORIENTATION=-
MPLPTNPDIESQESSAACDFRSARFDPLVALKDPNARPPVESVRARNNIFECRDLLPTTNEHFIQRKLPSRGKDSPVSQSAHLQSKSRGVISKFSKKFREPLPIACVSDHFSESMGLRDKWKARKDGRIFGPLSVLTNLFSAKKRVLVLIRGDRILKSTITGYLRAFDKHMNLILVDAQETLVKPGSRRSPRLLRQVFVRGENVVLLGEASP